MKPAEIFFRNFKNNNIFLLRYCSGRVVVKNIPKGNAVFGIHDAVAIFVCCVFCSHIHAPRSYPVARISSEKLKEILPNALVVVQNVYGTYVARWRKFEIP